MTAIRVRNRPRSALLLLAVAAFIFPTTSNAETRPFGEFEAGLYRIAQAYWEQEPSLCTTVERRIVPWEAIHASGAATQPTNPGTACVYELDEDELFDMQETCITALHEYGHLLGLGHSSDPYNIMYPSASTYFLLPSVVPQCNDPIATIAALPPETSPPALVEQSAIDRAQKRLENRRLQCRSRSQPRRCWARVRHRQRTLHRWQRSVTKRLSQIPRLI